MSGLDNKAVNRGTRQEIAAKIRSSLNKSKLRHILLYAHNGTGKTRLSLAFKDAGDIESAEGEITSDTLYFNALTEDLFYWDNDRKVLKVSRESAFITGLETYITDQSIRDFFSRYVEVYFELNRHRERGAFENWEIEFLDTPDADKSISIKISRGEERIFIWCFFLAIMQLVFDDSASEDGYYSWVKYIYIDDPISSLDDNNAVLVATDLADILLKNKLSRVKVVISSHHGLFFNVIFNELNYEREITEAYFMKREEEDDRYLLKKIGDVPYFYHLYSLGEIKRACESNEIYYHHFSQLRSVFEKTASFFGLRAFSELIANDEDRRIFSRILNLRSHGKHSLYELSEVEENEKLLLKRLFSSFMNKYNFALPEIFTSSVQFVEPK